MPAPVRNSRKREITFIKWVALASFVLSLLQLMLGADPFILMLCLATEAVCLWPVVLYGFDRTVAIFYLFIWLSFSFSALVFKTAMLQSLDSNLFNPILTLSIQLVGAIAFSIAASIAYLLKPAHHNSIKIVLNPETLSIAGKIFFILGVIGFSLSHINTQDSIAIISGGGLSLLSTIGTLINPLIGYGIVCETASIILRSNRKATFSVTSIIMMGILVILSLLGNSKSGILLPALIYLSCVGAFRARIRWQTVLTAVLTLIFLSQFLFPAVHIARTAKGRANPIEIGAMTIGAVANLMVGDSQTLAEKDALNTQIQNSPDLYRNLYFGSQQVWLDRFTNTGFVDAAARRMDFDGPFLGVAPVVGNTFYSVLPRQLNPNKYDTVQMAAGDAILQAYGLQPAYHVSFSTVPLPVELFAAGGFWAIFSVGIPLICLVVFELNFFVFDFKNNPWSICFIIMYGHAFYAETHDSFAFMALRQMPIDFLMLTLGMVLAAMIKNGFHAAGGGRAERRAVTL